MATELLNALVDKVPALLEQIYGDLAKPGVQQAGKAIGGILGLGNTILYPLHLLNGATESRLKINLDSYRKKVENLELRKVQKVPAEIGVPILEKLAYVSDETLTDIYTTLLAKASSNQSNLSVPPHFIHIVSHLAPIEAQILNDLYSTSIPDDLGFKLGTSRLRDLLPEAYLIAFGVDMQTPERIVTTKHRVLVSDSESFTYIFSGIETNYSNLVSMGLVNDSNPVHNVPDPGKKIYSQCEKILETRFPISATKREILWLQKIELTSTGHAFVEACLNPISESQVESELA